jgi:hypothetical protein
MIKVQGFQRQNLGLIFSSFNQFQVLSSLKHFMFSEGTDELDQEYLFFSMESCPLQNYDLKSNFQIVHLDSEKIFSLTKKKLNCFMVYLPTL